MARGCGLEQQDDLPLNIQYKQIHLYSDSEQKSTAKIPEDFYIGEGDERFNVRLRLNQNSPFKIFRSDQTYYLKKHDSIVTQIEFLTSPKFRLQHDEKLPISSICTRLGNDTLGVVPSNYCFYFKNGKQCRFCELLPTHKKEVEFTSTLKPLELLIQCITSALKTDPDIKHIGLITGNIISYDWTIEYFCKIGEGLQTSGLLSKIQDFNATIMPPEDFSLIDRMYAAGFNKIYFPLEVYDKNQFEIVCPGKKEYGYKKILDALEYALKIFKPGNVFTNFVYGMHSLDANLNPNSFDAQKEMDMSLVAVDSLLNKGIIPGFTIYHYGGYNDIGKIIFEPADLYLFFKEWGRRVYLSNLVSKRRETPLYGRWSFSNTLINDGFWLAKQTLN